jgi:hypothetical protein
MTKLKIWYLVLCKKVKLVPIYSCAVADRRVSTCHSCISALYLVIKPQCTELKDREDISLMSKVSSAQFSYNNMKLLQPWVGHLYYFVSEMGTDNTHTHTLQYSGMAYVSSYLYANKF